MARVIAFVFPILCFMGIGVYAAAGGDVGQARAAFLACVVLAGIQLWHHLSGED